MSHVSNLGVAEHFFTSFNYPRKPSIYLWRYNLPETNEHFYFVVILECYLQSSSLILISTLKFW